MKKLLVLTLLCVATSALAYRWEITLSQEFKDAHKDKSGKYALTLYKLPKKTEVEKRVVVQVDEMGEVVPLLEDIRGLGAADVKVEIAGHKIVLTGGAWCITAFGVSAYDGPFAGQNSKASTTSAGCHNSNFEVKVESGKLKAVRF